MSTFEKMRKFESKMLFEYTIDESLNFLKDYFSLKKFTIIRYFQSFINTDKDFKLSDVFLNLFGTVDQKIS